MFLLRPEKQIKEQTEKGSVPLEGLYIIAWFPFHEKGWKHQVASPTNTELKTAMLYSELRQVSQKDHLKLS